MAVRKTCRIVTSSRIGILLLFLMLTWVYAFMNYSMYRAQPGLLESDRIRQRILDDSENYVKALAREEKQGLNVQNSGVVYDLKRTLAVLLESILERLGNVEQKVDVIYNNNSQLLRNVTGLAEHKHNQAKNEVEHQNESIFTNKKKVVVKKDLGIEGDQPLLAKDLIMQPEAKCSYLDDELRGFPDCTKKVAWMKEMWSSDPCYKKYGVDGSDCSFLIYLSEVETWCPKLKWRKQTPKSLLVNSERPKATIQKDKAGLMTVLNKAYLNKLEWVRLRIDRMWDSKWMPAAEVLEKKQDLTNREQKKILIHMGLLTKESGFKIAEKAFSGGPLGELVQWSDILASLYILGHELEVSVTYSSLKTFLKGKGVVSQSCPIGGERPFDLVYIDIVGLKQFKKASGSLWKQLNCMLRVIDSFGTEPAYNIRKYMKRTGRKTDWGGWELLPTQFFTMFPHTPDNSYMGFVVENNEETQTKKSRKRDNKALVYGKMSYMWKEANAHKFLEIINQRFEIHATVHVDQNQTEEVDAVPSYIHNHGILSVHDLQHLLKETKLFIGLGFPYEGPAPLEAIANGCMFLNPSFGPPKSKSNTKFFKNKPTERELTSQHPYAEVYIGKPHVWTINVQNSSAVQEAIDEISRVDSPQPYLPYEFQCEGMLQRLNAYISNQDFCNHPNSWPPKSAMHIRTSKLNQSCKKRCMEDDLICEPTWFHHLNYKDVIEKKFGAECKTVDEVDEVYVPAINPVLSSCKIQTNSLLFSCAGQDQDLRRICPCRTYIKGQVALCQECIL
ncbi:alpha-1,6-mannosylglycoprotein 6-beta-N-acetylglucosaminyltransferase A-like isoform X1 [Asterias rubens]|uniref:alpha-1,6-mannosylglycoprotein 6-beta-N-acetylglucosaminyltransferase A-like isoform X1 n=2 Tax=Asterias rubens TaxID=7604 RepID=UPI0014551F67|nr:alpha-1,6-mannosylglycoprotein 6-beta-N-acetylglucosaminyltransferase A-like isoform X1 [Asterias rubens]XP_033629094.1 alpha-1,6-mannosylglycoprotein 6-beta-N-acetylglucosaminyltransferase A-like isoform X1 [Asterias rubens]XP_033629095.1 alpha-1,6-mannosylglycoprotein 6-beta-N-acetylglucosaminyltransferase A-like isoform X1 [Asterias rubens]XP_033629096.1 alpha-1,6-mannosylglycoprotein 6-beta-N-acetylglucosaminyltransferase A-like isoform X1 [Asterias rubens]XP_033629097.1 alpha-1,6-mannos